MSKGGFQRPSARKLAAKTLLHPKPMLDEKNTEEDGFDDSVVKKLKVQNDSPEQPAPSPNPENSNNTATIDIAKKKLDSMFNRNQNQKKRFQTRVLTVIDNYIDIDKLMVQYGGILAWESKLII